MYTCIDTIYLNAWHSSNTNFNFSFGGPPWKGCMNSNSNMLLQHNCPNFNLFEAKTCLERRNVNGLIYVGDSLSFQESQTMSCYFKNSLNQTWKTGDGYALEYLVDLPFPVINFHAMPNKKSNNTAGGILKGLQSAFHDNALPDNLLWMVNVGIWHLVCDEENDMCPDKLYKHHMKNLLDFITSKVNKNIIVRETTASHAKNMKEIKSGFVSKKFSKFTFKNTENLNKNLKELMTYYPNIKYNNFVYNLTLHRYDDLIDNDMRHYKGSVIYYLLYISYLLWCKYL